MSQFKQIPHAQVFQKEDEEKRLQAAQEEGHRRHLLVLDAKAHEPFFVERLMEARAAGKSRLSIKAKDLPCTPEGAVLYFQNHGYQAEFGVFGFWRETLEVRWAKL